jgi:outer membrane lipoprotein-sorting protein
MTRLLWVALCVLLIVAGCGGSADERAVEKKIEAETGGKADVDISKGTMEVTGKTDEGEYSMAAGKETKIPEDFPGDVLIYKPSEAVMAVTVPEGNSVTLTTQDDRDKVVAAYKKEMVGQGWSEEGSMTMGSSVMLIYKKDDRTASINVTTTEEATQITLTVSTE